MRSWKHTPVALALAAMFPAAMAQSNAELMQELQNLKNRVIELESKLKESEKDLNSTP